MLEEHLKREIGKVNPDRQYLPSEICDGKILRCSQRTIYRLVTSGQLHGLRIGQGIRIFGWSIIEYIKNNWE